MGWRLATCDVPDRPLSYFFTLGSRFNTSVRIGSTADCTDDGDTGVSAPTTCRIELTPGRCYGKPRPNSTSDKCGCALFRRDGGEVA
jgi:hypothetical protein